MTKGFGNQKDANIRPKELHHLFKLLIAIRYALVSNAWLSNICRPINAHIFSKPPRFDKSITCLDLPVFIFYILMEGSLN